MKTQYIVVAIDLTGKEDSHVIRRFPCYIDAENYADRLNAFPGVWYYTVIPFNAQPPQEKSTV